MKNIQFPACNTVVGAGQPEYLPLHAFVDDRVTVTCYKLSFRERLNILFIGRLWLGQMNFGSPLQPQLPTTNVCDLLEKDERGER